MLISSHVLGEVQQTADDIVLLARGRLVTRGPLAELEAAQSSVLVRSSDRERLASALVPRRPRAAWPASRAWSRSGRTAWTSPGWTTDDVGRLAHREGMELLELSTQPGALERLFLQLTGEASARGGPTAAGPSRRPPAAAAAADGEVQA